MEQQDIAFVTGASRGIGRAIALRLAADGMRVVAVARDAARLEELAGADGDILPLGADVSDRQAMESATREVLETWGVPSLVVANAGRLGPIGPLWESDPDDWWADLEVNLRGSYLTVRGFLPEMVASGRGRLVFFGGGGSTRVFPWVSSYAAAKVALLRLAETLDLELDGTGVHAFSVSPGFVRTDMTERFAESEAGRRYVTDLAERLDRGESTPPEACAALVARIGAGDLDALHGRFLHAGVDLDDLDALRERAPEIATNEERVLGLKGFSL